VTRPQRPPQSLEGKRFWRDLREAVGIAVVVEDEPLRLLAVALLAHGHALVEDVPGVGKTLLTRAFSQALGLTFARVPGTPDLLPSAERAWGAGCPRRRNAEPWLAGAESLASCARPEVHTRATAMGSAQRGPR
jgi:ATPase family associated with various cellular activities (AAA)